MHVLRNFRVFFRPWRILSGRVRSGRVRVVEFSLKEAGNLGLCCWRMDSSLYQSTNGRGVPRASHANRTSCPTIAAIVSDPPPTISGAAPPAHVQPTSGHGISTKGRIAPALHRRKVFERIRFVTRIDSNLLLF